MTLKMELGITLVSIFIIFFKVLSVDCQQVTVQRGNITVIVKQSVELKCVFNEADYCSWQRDGLPLQVPNEEDGYSFSNRPNPNEKGTDCSMKIAAITEWDFAKWRCSTIPTNSKPAVAGSEIWISRQVTPSDPVIFFKGNTTNEIKLPTSDEPINNLVCESEMGNPAPKLTWELRGLEYLGQVVIRKVGPDLYSAKLTWDRRGGWQLFNDSKEIVCKSTHPGLKTPKFAAAILRSNYAPKRVKIWVNGFDEHNVYIGPDEKLILACIADGQPTPTYTWEVWSVEDDLWKLVNNSEQNITLTFDLLGKYRCKASNDLNKYQPKVSANEIDVLTKPQEISHFMRNFGITLGVIILLILFVLGCFLIKKYCRRRKTQRNCSNVKPAHDPAEQGIELPEVRNSVEHTYEAIKEVKEPDYLDPIPLKRNARLQNSNEPLYVNVAATKNDLFPERKYLTIIQ